MPTPTRLVVLATGDLAVPTLGAIHEAGHDIVRIIVHGKRAGEDEFLPEERLGSSLVEWAGEHRVEVRRPQNPGGEGLRSSLSKLGPEVGLMVAFGRRFPITLLEVPERGWLKVHFALLPKYRGLHPIRAALWNGQREAGVSVIQVTQEPDAGPILAQQSIEVAPTETFGALSPRLAELAAGLATSSLESVLRSTKTKARAQNEKVASNTPRFGPRHQSAPWWHEAKVVFDRLRALSPSPGMFTFAKRQRVRILRGAPMDWVEAPYGGTGSLVGVRLGRLAILCGNGTVFGIQRLRLPDGSEVGGSEFARSVGLQAGFAFI